MIITCYLVGGPFSGRVVRTKAPHRRKSTKRSRHVLITKWLPEDMNDGDKGFLYQSKTVWDGESEIEVHCIGQISDRRGVDIDCRDPVTAPSPAQIAALCLEIQSGWTHQQRKKAGTFREKVYRRSQLQHSGDEES